MNIYSYSSLTYEYAGVSKARIDPISGNYLVPAYATTITPKVCGDNEVAVFNIEINGWEVKADYRSLIWYMKSTGNKYEGVKKIGKVPDEYTTSEKPEGYYTWDNEVENWVFDKDAESEAIQAAYKADLATLDPMLAHILRHERNGDFERAARAESEFEIKQAEIMEEYGRGEMVYITETGECYHTTEDCSALANAVGVREINKSDGLKNYSPCSICCN